MGVPSPSEISRQYRVGKQALAMHSDLRYRYARTGLLAEVVLLVSSAATAATTFAGDELYRGLHVDPTQGRFSVGILSIVAFAGSLILLVVDPRAQSARHRDAVRAWWSVVDRFRRARLEDDTWPAAELVGLVKAYSLACESATPIPNAKFNRLKSRYLRKVEASRRKYDNPSCPIPLLSLFLRARDTFLAIRALIRGDHRANSGASDE